MKISSILPLLAFVLFAGSIPAQIAQQPEDISPLLIGEMIPEANLLDTDGKTISLSSKIKEKPTVLVFYRGGWCPYCNLQLSGLAKAEAEILELGYQIIAISPEDYSNLQGTIEADKVSYQLYADPEGQLTQAVGLAFEPNQKTKMYMGMKSKGKASQILPVPAVFVLNTEGLIQFEYINPSYQTRLSEKLLLAVLKNL